MPKKEPTIYKFKCDFCSKTFEHKNELKAKQLCREHEDLHGIVYPKLTYHIIREIIAVYHAAHWDDTVAAIMTEDTVKVLKKWSNPSRW